VASLAQDECAADDEECLADNGVDDGGSSECTDSHESCEEWAQVGECVNNPAYMLFNCKKSCGSCESPCVRFDDKPALEANGYTSLFETAFENGKKMGYKPEIISKDPWLIVFDSLLTPDECDRVYEEAGTNFQRSGELGSSSNGPMETQHRTSETSFCIEECHELEIVQSIRTKVFELFNYQIPENNYEFLQLVRYGEGKYYREHHDSNEQYVEMPMGPRILTFFFYLNEVEEGGETSFPRLDVKVKPKKGRAVLWANMRDDDIHRNDLRTIHAALPVIKGFKKAANFWIYQYDYQTPWQVGCTG